MNIFTQQPSPELRATTRGVIPGVAGDLAHLTEAAINVAASSAESSVAAGHYEHGQESSLHLGGFMKTLERAGQAGQFQTPGQKIATVAVEASPEQLTPEEIAKVVALADRAGRRLVHERASADIAA